MAIFWGARQKGNTITTTRSCLTYYCGWGRFLPLKLQFGMLFLRNYYLALALPVVMALLLFGSLRWTSYRANHTQLVTLPINDIRRECPLPTYPTLHPNSSKSSSNLSKSSSSSSFSSSLGSSSKQNQQQNQQQRPKICLTTLTDATHADWWQRMVRWRDFGNLLDMTWPNKQHYCDKHGYQLFNESAQLDTSRPPSWSKIRAAHRLLTEEDCDWVYWMDADTVIMNSDKRIEEFLPTPETGIDLVIARQKGPSWNAGAWLLRRSAWSLHFLEQWWNYTDHIRPKGLSVSGDNDALRTHLRAMDPAEFAEHIAVPPRCLFNSVAKFMTREEKNPFVTHPELVQLQSWYLDLERYHLGDLVAHVAGVHNKISTTQLLLRDAR